MAANRAACANALKASPKRLVTLYQIHSSTVIETNASWNGEPPKADGVVTTTPGLMLGILTADCMPFLFADLKAGVIGAAHAGWRGALGGENEEGGVIENTITKMISLGASTQNIVAALGPCLRQPNFEVGDDLVDAFLTKHPEADRFFAPGVSKEKRQFDLAGFGHWRLAEIGVTKLHDTGICTLGEKQHYFSYRATKRANEPDYGRNLSAIVLPE